MKPYFVVLIIIFTWSSNYAQTHPSYKKRQSFSNGTEAGSFGLGIGLDYGGFGGRFTYLLDPHIAVFGAGGYALSGFGYNVGAIARFMPAKKFVPTITAMYGYNAAISVKNAAQYDKLYYGPSIGLGLIRKSNRNEKNYWHYELIIPFRSSDYDADLNAIKSNPSISISTTPPPVLFSIGYHFGF